MSTPGRARASEGEGATDFKRVVFVDIAWRPALVPLRNDVMPGMRTHLMLGARLSPTFTLGTMAHVTPYFGQIPKNGDKEPKVGAGLDVIRHRLASPARHGPLGIVGPPPGLAASTPYEPVPSASLRRRRVPNFSATGA